MSRCECVQCGYDLTPLVRSVREEATCPECGHVGVPVPVNFMGVLKSQRRTLVYMTLPMMIAGGLVMLLGLVGFGPHGLPMLVGVPLAVLTPTVVSTTREGRARGRPIWGESLWLILAAWAISGVIFVVSMWIARVV